MPIFRWTMLLPDPASESSKIIMADVRQAFGCEIIYRGESGDIDKVPYPDSRVVKRGSRDGRRRPLRGFPQPQADERKNCHDGPVEFHRFLGDDSERDLQ